MNTLPAHLLNRRSAGLTAAVSQGLSSGAPPYLSIKAQRFTLIDAAGNEKPLQTLYADVVIVQANPTVSRVFYDVAYNPQAQEFQPPACWSDNGKAPSSQAAKPQSQTCASCPQAAWGSAVSNVSGKGIPACSQNKKLAIVMADNPDMPFLLRIPPNSLKHLSAYVKTIAAQSAGDRAVEVSDIVTRISFDPQVQGTLNFSAIGWVDEKAVAAMDKIWETKAADDLVGLNDQPYQGPIALSAPGATRVPQGQLPPPPADPMIQLAVNTAPRVPSAPPAQTVPSVPQASAPPTAAAASPRGRGRPKKDAAAQPAFMQHLEEGANESMPTEIHTTVRNGPPPAHQAAAPVQDGIPAFLRRDQAGAVANPPAPSEELSRKLEEAMRLPVPGGR